MTPAKEAPVPDQSTTGRHIPALDGLRGLAILLVLMCHLLWSSAYPQGNFVIRFLARIHIEGWIGVSLFFVLSGFLITGILYDTLGDTHFFKNFYARRMLRIFPLYYGFILLLFLITCFTGEHWYKGLPEILTYTENLPIVGTRYTDAAWINLNHFWSLAIEEQFYFVWPLMVFALRSGRKIAIAAVSGMAFSFFVRLAWVLFSDMKAHQYVLYSWTPSQLDGLLFGGLIAMAVRSRYRGFAMKVAPWLLGVGAVCIVAIALHDGRLQSPDHLGSAVAEPLILAVMFGGMLLCCLRAGTLQTLFALPVLRFFGRYSYGLYVYHYTLVNVILEPLRSALLTRGQSKAVALVVPAAFTLAASVMVAWVSFHFFEASFLRLKDRFTHGAAGPVLADTVNPAPARL